MIKKWLVLFVIVFIGLIDYKIAKFSQGLFLGYGFTYAPSISIPWLLISVIPVLIVWKDSGLTFDIKEYIKNRSKIVFLVILVLIGLLIFVVLGITKYFHAVNYPIIFFLITPIAEELLFRGFIYGQTERLKIGSPVIISSLLFGLHHFQYFNYHLTPFAVFQIVYTLILGLMLGNMRKNTKNIYLGILVHILINYISYKY